MMQYLLFILFELLAQHT